MRAVDRPQLFAARLADRADFLNALQSRNTRLAACCAKPTTTLALVALLKLLAAGKALRARAQRRLISKSATSR